MHNIYSEILKLQQANIGAALCTITNTIGSSARKAGTKMIVKEDASIIGTIGGGTLEKTIIEEALKIIKTAKPQKFNFDFSEDLSMNCGGKTEIFIEPIALDLKLYIFGAGHVGKALWKLAKKFGFRISLLDNRQNIFENIESNQDNFLIGEYPQLIDNLEFNDKTFIVILTHQHQLDEEILATVIKKQYAYLGMIGSKSKIATTRKKLISEKGITKELLDKVNMPIGIPFNAQLPEEIALSILVKLIDVKNNL